MAAEPPRVARIDRHELADLPPGWTFRQRGQYLRLLLQGRGIDPRRLFRVEYHPRRRCWLVIQPAEPVAPPEAKPPTAESDERLYVQTMTLFRRVGLAAWSALAAGSPHFARCGRPFEPPADRQELTPAELAKLLQGAGEGGPRVRFTGEGGWRVEPSGN